MAQKITLKKGQTTLVDDEDYERLFPFDWQLSSQGYAVRYIKRANGRWTSIYLHRVAMRVTNRSIEIDHIDRDRLNNIKSNLRLATHSENQRHRGIPKNNKSHYKGVSRFGDKFSAALRFNGRHLHIALVDDPILAAQLYDALAHRLFGAFALPNFQSADTTPEVDTLIAKALLRFRKRGLNL